ncbi:hypothetical protein E1B28_011977 [Marasmius oreades]|uniref:Uncharacterized protein n=1 Tax=Marasmius oreades TaxID=181124 RepID=A0A9P7UPF8_9AGAR|nr:uncharacterized protein E1B28_011977 [Marasmius oreades]KAG7087931.1 hypothetical protein E1B28_011977 [Marasmius oreades]
MCIVFWTFDHPDYSLILCSNRDEYLSRPTKDAAFHSFEHDHEAHSNAPGAILSGIDEMGGGTWLGLSRTGKVAVLTNITEAFDPSVITSRGSLVSSFLLLESDEPFEEQVRQCFPRDAKYSGFNLLLFAPRVVPATSSQSSDLELRYDNSSLVTNGGACGPITSRQLSAKERSCGGFSNGVDGVDGDGSEWPKVTHGLRDLENLISQVTQASNKQTDESELADRLFELLSWKSPEPLTERSQLRNTVEVVPLPATWGSGRAEYYGTRLSTVLLIRRDGQVTFIERDIWKLVDGKVTRWGGNIGNSNNKSPTNTPSERTFRFQLDLRSPS